MDKKAWLFFGAILVALVVGDAIPSWVLLIFGAGWLAYAGHASRKLRKDEEDREQQLIVQEAPELLGMDFVTRATFMMKTAEEFAANTSPEDKQRYADAVRESKALFEEQNKVMPAWICFVTMRKIQSDDIESKSSHAT